MDHLAQAEALLSDLRMNPDGTPHNWQRFLTHAVIGLAQRVELLAVVHADLDEEEEYEE